uniref:Uncharacterized protein n=1 Tax=Meloidogyne javanica TaxID=6303 RepID=A0A915MEY4_MELJA
MEKLTNLFIEFLSIDCTDEIPSEDLIIESMKFNYKQFLDSLINLEFFEVYANTEDEEDANKSKNRLYSLIGNELGNLQIEYPILIPFEENNEEESLYLTEEELEESINAEIRINASLLLGTFQGIYDHFVEEVDDDETKELGNNIKNKFFDLIKKRIEIANCFICLYASLIDNEDLDEGLDDEEIETLIDKLKEMKFEDVKKVLDIDYVENSTDDLTTDDLDDLEKGIKEKHLTTLGVMGNTPIELYNQLKEMVHLIEGTLKVDNKNIEEKNIYFIIHQLHLQKLISSRNILFIKEKSQNLKENIISILFGVEESDKVEECMLNKWAEENFKADYEFLIGGSLMLEVNTENSDIDAIYVVRKNTEYFWDEEIGEENLNNDGTKQLISRATQFFGPLTSKCLDNKEENCSDNSSPDAVKPELTAKQDVKLEHKPYRFLSTNLAD